MFDGALFDSDVFDVEAVEPATEPAEGGVPRRRRRRPRVEEPLVVPIFDPLAPPKQQIHATGGIDLFRVTAEGTVSVRGIPRVVGRGEFVLSSIIAAGAGGQRLRAAGVATLTLPRAELSARQAQRASGEISLGFYAAANARQRVTGSGEAIMKLSAAGEGFEDGLLLQHVRELQDVSIITGADDLSGQLLLLEDQGWRDVHRSADEVLDEFTAAIRSAMKDGKIALNRPALIAALERGDQFEVFALMSGAISVRANGLRNAFEKYFEIVIEASGTRAVRRLKRALRKGLRAATAEDDIEAILQEFGFDVTNPAAVEWIKEHAGDLVTDISEGTREKIRDLVEKAFVEGVDVRDLADEIEGLVDDPAKAETIARTETMTASNEGQAQAWDQAVEEGLLTGTERKEWIVTPDDRLCPICEPMDGVQVGLYEDFDVEGERVDQPPAHPNCRCTIALAVD